MYWSLRGSLGFLHFIYQLHQPSPIWCPPYAVAINSGVDENFIFMVPDWEGWSRFEAWFTFSLQHGTSNLFSYVNSEMPLCAGTGCPFIRMKSSQHIVNISWITANKMKSQAGSRLWAATRSTSLFLLIVITNTNRVMLRCHISISTQQDGTANYVEWQWGNLFVQWQSIMHFTSENIRIRGGVTEWPSLRHKIRYFSLEQKLNGWPERARNGVFCGERGQINSK